MAISEETAAIVAAQLTAAWAALEAQRPGVGGRKIEGNDAAVMQAYLRFKGAVTEVPISGYDIKNVD